MSQLNHTSIHTKKRSFIALDRLLEIDIKKRIICLKNISCNDPYLQEIEPSRLAMPNTLLLECLTQAAMILMNHHEDLSGRFYTLLELQKASFLHTAIPGDQLRIEVECIKEKENNFYFHGLILVNGLTICEARFIFQGTEAPSSPTIHPTASVHPSAVLGKGVSVGPYSIIGEHVYIGDNSIIEAHVMIDKWTRIGVSNHIHFGTVIGSKAQDIKYHGEESWVLIGDHNEIREYVTINRPTGKQETTKLGSHSMILTTAHIGHNCILGNKITLANAVHLGGHVIIEDRAIIGGLTGVHQFVRIGAGTMTGGYSRLIQDVPPFMLCDGNPAYVRGLNAVGLKRSGVKGEAFKALKDAYKILYRSNMNLKQAMTEIQTLPQTPPLQELISFLKTDTSRGISKKMEPKSERG